MEAFLLSDFCENSACARICVLVFSVLMCAFFCNAANSTVDPCTVVEDRCPPYPGEPGRRGFGGVCESWEEERSEYVSPYHAVIGEMIKGKRWDLMVDGYSEWDSNWLTGDFACLIKKRKSVHVSDKQGVTPLHLAAGGGVDAEVVASLLDLGADVNAVDQFGFTPLHVAMEHNGNLSVLDVLLDGGANAGLPFRKVWRPCICWRGTCVLDPQTRIKTGWVDMLSEAGFDVNAEDRGGSTPLHYAVQHYNWGMIRVLLELGAEADPPDDQGKTPLHWLAQYRNFYFPEALESLEVCQERGERYFSYYKIYGPRAFPEHSGEPEWEWRRRDYQIRSDWLDMERMLAKCEAVHQVIDALLEAGADVNAMTQDGSTPLHYATKYSNLMFMRKFLEAGADPNLKNRDGGMPLRHAIRRKRTGIRIGAVGTWGGEKRHRAGVSARGQEEMGGVRDGMEPQGIEWFDETAQAMMPRVLHRWGLSPHRGGRKARPYRSMNCVARKHVRRCRENYVGRARGPARTPSWGDAARIT